MTYVIIHALAPIFVIMLLGFWAGKAGMVDNKNVSLLNIFVMDFALPATLFSATVQTPWAGIVAQSPLVLVLTGAMWITYAAIYFLATSVFKRTPQDAAVLTLTVALPNYAALGLPILGSVLGAIFIVMVDPFLTALKDDVPVLGASLATTLGMSSEGAGKLRDTMSAIGSAAGLKGAIYGLIIMMFILFEPYGLYGRWLKVKLFFQLFPLYKKATFKRQKTYVKSERNR